MSTKVDEIAPHIYRRSTLVPEIGPRGFTFNQFLLDDDEPLLFHTGHRSMFPATIERLADLRPGTLALMHGSSFTGDGQAALREGADLYTDRLQLTG